MPHENIIAQGPFFWGGGPFQNGTNNLHSLWSETGFKERVAGIKVQWFNEDKDRLLTNAPPRNHCAGQFGTQQRPADTDGETGL